MSNSLINAIKARKGLFRLNGANDDQIDDAEKILGLKFSEEYKAYLKEFGCISFDSHEFQGLNTSDRLSVVLTTQFEKMSRKNGKKLLITIAVGAVVVKAVRDVIKAKKQGEELKTVLDDFYEEELNWWDREHEEGEEL